jgi:diguanylate cyclase (GGDEF)-like protein
VRIRGWLTGLIVFLLAPCLLFASLWFYNKFEDVNAFDRSLDGLNLIQALGPLVEEKAVTGKLESAYMPLREDLIRFGGSSQAEGLTRMLDVFVNEPDVKTSLGYAQELSAAVSHMAKLDFAVSHESSTLPDLVTSLLFSVIIESSKMTDNARKLGKRETINVFEKMLIPVQAGKFKAAADGAALRTEQYFDALTGPGAEDLQQRAQVFRKANFVFQRFGSKLLSSTIQADSGSNINAEGVIEVHPDLIRATFTLWHGSLNYLHKDLLQQRRATERDVTVAGLVGGLIIVAAFAIAVALSRRLAARTLREFENLGFHDPLTGLPNRRALVDTMRSRPVPQADMKTGLLVVDLRQFKKINDRFGDSAGDSILRDVAQVLTKYAEPEDFISRTGGTEFTLLRPNLPDTEAFERLARSIIHDLGKDRTIYGQKTSIECNAGLLVSREGEPITDQFLTDVALALRSAKQRGPRNYDLFTSQMRVAFEENGEIAKELQLALRDGDIVPWFQPQVDIHTGEVVGAEALARWIDEGTVRYPGSFLPAAVEAGYLEQIDARVRGGALKLAASLSGRTRKPVHLGLNVSTSLLTSARAVDELHQQVRTLGLEPSSISLEILEAVMIDEATADPIKENIARLSDFGFFIELDDFGTGHSSISSLRDLKVDRVKIDRSFISGVDKNPGLQKFTSALINLAKSLDISVLAEGVETEGERTWLKQNGCDVVQGFLISKAVPEDQLAALILKQNFRRPSPAVRQPVSLVQPA